MFNTNCFATFLSLTFFGIYLFLVIDKELNYDHLALGLREALQNDKSALDADRLQKYTGILAYSFNCQALIVHLEMFLHVNHVGTCSLLIFGN